MTSQDDRSEADGLAPVIPLFGAMSPSPEPRSPRAVPDRPAGRRENVSAASRVTFSAPDVEDAESGPAEVDDEAAARAASDALLKKLRSRSLSVREARTFLSQQDLPDEAAEQIVDDMLHLGYLDDAALAEQTVHIAVSRRGEGRAAIALALSRRGIPREIADEALAAVGDDDAERALEYARRKVSSVSGRDDETALRRLVGQLARRGYPSGIALTAARQALRERRPVLRGPRFD